MSKYMDVKENDRKQFKQILIIITFILIILFTLLFTLAYFGFIKSNIF